MQGVYKSDEEVAGAQNVGKRAENSVPALSLKMVAAVEELVGINKNAALGRVDHVGEVSSVLSTISHSSNPTLSSLSTVDTSPSVDFDFKQLRPQRGTSGSLSFSSSTSIASDSFGGCEVTELPRRRRKRTAISYLHDDGRTDIEADIADVTALFSKKCRVSERNLKIAYCTESLNQTSTLANNVSFTTGGSPGGFARPWQRILQIAQLSQGVARTVHNAGSVSFSTWELASSATPECRLRQPPLGGQVAEEDGEQLGISVRDGNEANRSWDSTSCSEAMEARHYFEWSYREAQSHHGFEEGTGEFDTSDRCESVCEQSGKVTGDVQVRRREGDGSAKVRRDRWRPCENEYDTSLGRTASESWQMKAAHAENQSGESKGGSRISDLAEVGRDNARCRVSPAVEGNEFADQVDEKRERSSCGSSRGDSGASVVPVGIFSGVERRSAGNSGGQPLLSYLAEIRGHDALAVKGLWAAGTSDYRCKIDGETTRECSYFCGDWMVEATNETGTDRESAFKGKERRVDSPEEGEEGIAPEEGEERFEDDPDAVPWQTDLGQQENMPRTDDHEENEVDLGRLPLFSSLSRGVSFSSASLSSASSTFSFSSSGSSSFLLSDSSSVLSADTYAPGLSSPPGRRSSDSLSLSFSPPQNPSSPWRGSSPSFTTLTSSTRPSPPSSPTELECSFSERRNTGLPTYSSTCSLCSSRPFSPALPVCHHGVRPPRAITFNVLESSCSARPHENEPNLPSAVARDLWALPDREFARRSVNLNQLASPSESLMDELPDSATHIQTLT